MIQSRNQKDLANYDFVMPRKLYESIKQKARASGMTKAEWVRRALAKAVGNSKLHVMPRGIGEKNNGRNR